MSILIRGGRIVTAADDYVADLYIEDETITLIGESLDMPADKVVDAGGKYVLPGCVDPHTHLDMPFGGTVTIDDVESGQTSAAFGGTTTSSSSHRVRRSRPRSTSGARRPTANR
jgi:dihydropyrimidinase